MPTNYKKLFFLNAIKGTGKENDGGKKVICIEDKKPKTGNRKVLKMPAIKNGENVVDIFNSGKMLGSGKDQWD